MVRIHLGAPPLREYTLAGPPYLMEVCCVRGSMRSHRSSPCDRSLTVEPQSSKLMARVRFPSVAPKKMNKGEEHGRKPETQSDWC